MVYAALGNAMEKDIHALSIKAYTPEQWNESAAGGNTVLKKGG